MVIDAETGKTIADIPGQKIAHGVAVVPEAGRGFISDGGGSGAIVIFDLKTNAILGSIVAQPDADGIIYDPGSGRVVVVSGDGGTLMTIKPDIDPTSGKIDAPIQSRGRSGISRLRRRGESICESNGQERSRGRGHEGAESYRALAGDSRWRARRDDHRYCQTPPADRMPEASEVNRDEH